MRYSFQKNLRHFFGRKIHDLRYTQVAVNKQIKTYHHNKLSAYALLALPSLSQLKVLLLNIAKRGFRIAQTP